MAGPSVCNCGAMDVPVLDDALAFELVSDAVGDTFRVVVARCHARDATDVPVVYVTDANITLGMTVDTIRYLCLSRFLPGVLVVGVGYPVGGFRNAQGLRSRDLTPTACEEMADAEGVPYPSGGADRFLSFVVDELQPLIAARHPVGPSSTYVGHSFGGLFGAFTLLERPQTFDRYVLASPSIWWDERVLLRRARAQQPGETSRRASVAILVGGEETPEGRARVAATTRVPTGRRPRREHDLVRDALDFAAELAAWPALTVRCRVLPGEHHLTVPPIAISLGLRAVFDAPDADIAVPALAPA